MKQVISGLALAGILLLFRGWTVSLVWNWHVADLAGQTITALQGLGLSLFVAMFRHYSVDAKTRELHNELVGDSADTTTKRAARVAIANILIVLFAWALTWVQ